MEKVSTGQVEGTYGKSGSTDSIRGGEGIQKKRRHIRVGQAKYKSTVPQVSGMLSDHDAPSHTLHDSE